MIKLKKLLLVCLAAFSGVSFLSNLFSSLYKPAMLYLSAGVFCVCLTICAWFYIKHKKSSSEAGMSTEIIETTVATGTAVGTVVAASALKSLMAENFLFDICLVVLVIAAILLYRFIKQMSKTERVKKATAFVRNVFDSFQMCPPQIYYGL